MEREAIFPRAKGKRVRSGYHAWIPVDYDRNNGIRIIRFMLTDDNAILKTREPLP